MAVQNEPERARLSLDVTQRVKDQLSELMNRTDAGSITEVIRRALALYDLATEHECEGGTIVFHHADGHDETVRLLF